MIFDHVSNDSNPAIQFTVRTLVSSGALSWPCSTLGFILGDQSGREAIVELARSSVMTKIVAMARARILGCSVTKEGAIDSLVEEEDSFRLATNISM